MEKTLKQLREARDYWAMIARQETRFLRKTIERAEGRAERELQERLNNKVRITSNTHKD